MPIWSTNCPHQSPTAIFTAPPMGHLHHSAHTLTPCIQPLHFVKPSSTDAWLRHLPGLVSSMLRFPLHPACAFTLLCNPCAPPFRLLSVSDISGQSHHFLTGDAHLTQGWALTTHPGSLQTTPPAHLLHRCSAVWLP